jgi:hypothetical protein
VRDSPLVQEFIEEGEQNRARKDVLQVIELRFGKEAVREVSAAVNRLSSLQQLDDLHKLAVQARRFTQVRRGLPTGTA